MSCRIPALPRLVILIGACLGASLARTAAASGSGRVRAASTVLRTLVFHDLTPMPGNGVPQINRGGANGPVISGDGSRGVFSTSVEDPNTHVVTHRVYTLNTDGTGQAEIDSNTSAAPYLDISDNGAVVLERFSTASAHNSLRVATGGGAQTVFPGLDSPEMYSSALSGDGSTAFFMLHRDCHLIGTSTVLGRGLWAIKTDGTGLRQVVNVNQVAAVTGLTPDQWPAFGAGSFPLDSSADASRVVFGAWKAEGSSWFFGVQGDGSGLHVIDGPFTYLGRGTISADGSTVLYGTTAWPYGSAPDQIAVARFDGSGKRVLATSSSYYGFNQQERGLGLTEDGSQANLGWSGRLVSTDGSSVLELTRQAAKYGLPGEMNVVSMSRNGRRFLYIPNDYYLAPLTFLEINPASLGAAPAIQSPNIDPPYVLTNARSAATVTTRMAPGIDSTSIWPMRNGAYDPNVYTSYGIGVLDDGKSYGDATAGDGLYTNNSLYANSLAAPGTLTVRLAAEVQADGKRHMTAIDVDPFAVVLNAPPLRPTQLAAQAVSATQVNLTWKDGSSNETGFRIERKSGAGSFDLVGQVAADVTRFEDKIATPNTLYSYRVLAVNDLGSSAASDPVNALTYPKVPGTLTAAALSTTDVRLEWEATLAAGSAPGTYQVERSTDDGSSFIRIAGGLTAAAYDDTGLTANGRYTYRVQAHNATGDSGFSSTAAARTLPAVQTGLTVTVPIGAAGQTRLDLAWTDPNTPAAAAKVERSTDGTAFAPLATVPAGTRTYSDPTASPNTRYHYRLRATNESGDSDPTAAVNALTLPAPFTNLTVTTPTAPTGRSVLDLAWTDSNPGGAAVKVERSRDGGPFEVVGTQAAGRATFRDTGLFADTPYTYRIRATNATGESDPTATASGRTLPLPSKPAAPSGLTARAVSRSQIDLSWSDRSNNEAGFRIYRQAPGGRLTVIKAVPANTRKYRDSGLRANTLYRYQVRAFNDGGDSAPSNTAGATTKRR